MNPDLTSVTNRELCAKPEHRLPVPARRMRKDVAIAFVVGLLAMTTVAGQDAQRVIVVNGELARVANVVIDGKVFVQVDDFVKAVGGTISAEANTLVVAIPSASVPGRAAGAFGTVRGTLTYLFNRNFGSRPDTGSEVALLAGSVDVPTDVMVLMVPAKKTLMLMRQMGPATPAAAINVEYKMAAYARADGNGSFSLPDVEPGDYTLVVMSAHTNGPTLRDVSHKAWIRKLTVRPGEMVDAFHDFGMRYH